MHAFARILALTAPLFLLVLLGFALTRWGKWPKAVADALTRFAFSVAIPALLFRLMSDFSQLPPVDLRVLIAYFGACFLVFVLGRFIAARLFHLDGVAQSVFGLGGIFANNVLLGIPLAKVTLGQASLPVISLVLVFNSLTLWTLATVSVEWARHRSFSWSGYVQAAKAVLANPVVASILTGTAWGLAALPLPGFVDQTLALIGEAAVPLSLIALGMGLGEYGISEGWRISASMTLLKLTVQPAVVWMLARLLGLPPLETQAIVLLAALPVGVNVYLMSRQFKTLGAPVAASLVLSTALAAATTPLILTLLGAAPA
ncbi:MAG TPA: AEC family transporter [Casimicrobiaceae bacterium]|jgi:predicted permease|nr:AEC family transporter [Casimicrobiaceae bacterium]